MRENTKKLPEFFENFHRLSREERIERLKQFCGLNEVDVDALMGRKALSLEMAEHFIENVVGIYSLPLGIATNFVIDGKLVPIPMVVEETSIVAAASATAKWVCKNGKISTYMKGNLIIGQIQIPTVEDVSRAREVLAANRDALIAFANQKIPGLVARGGGIHSLEFREIPRPDETGTMLVIHVLCNPVEAMGANIINQVCELLKPEIERLTFERVGLCILSNLVDTKLAVCEIEIPDVDPVVGHGIVEATQFAKADPYRATTHNKGVLNGIDPIVIATGNDWRAVEAGAHAYAARSGKYQPITDWWMEGRTLHGRLELPMALGTVGGVTRLHPTAKVALKILGADTSEKLARVCVSVGLVQNLGALKALATVGIVKGHMQLHAANLALQAGAAAHELQEMRELLADCLKVEKKIDVTRAKQILQEVRERRGELLH